MLAVFRVATSLLLAGLGGWTTFQERASLSGVITDTDRPRTAGRKHYRGLDEQRPAHGRHRSRRPISNRRTSAGTLRHRGEYGRIRHQDGGHGSAAWQQRDLERSPAGGSAQSGNDLSSVR